MKKSIRTLAAAVVAVLALAAHSSSAHAQDVPLAKVNVPFAFQLGSQHFAAGSYTLAEVQGRFLRVKGDNVASMEMIVAEYTAPDHGSVIVFHKCGDKYFVAGLRLGSRGEAYALPRSREEKEAARAELASMKPSGTPQDVAVQVAAN